VNEALDHYMDANEQLSGYYLVEEHIAEAWRRLGRTEEAYTLYLDIVTRTDAPEFMDALASIAATCGDLETSATWAREAATAYEADLRRFPRAATGHALRHYLEFGPVDRAIELAESNHATRPNGEAKRLLAEAYHLGGRVGDATAIVDVALSEAWISADLLETAMLVYDQAGRSRDAIAAHEALCTLTPRRC